jgi:hypothetical protein
MASLFSSSEYIDIVLVCGEALVLLGYREFPCYILWLESAATTIRNNRGMLERVEESFRRRLHYCTDNNGAAVTLNTSCNG